MAGQSVGIGKQHLLYLLMAIAIHKMDLLVYFLSLALGNSANPQIMQTN